MPPVSHPIYPPVTVTPPSSTAGPRSVTVPCALPEEAETPFFYNFRQVSPDAEEEGQVSVKTAELDMDAVERNRDVVHQRELARRASLEERDADYDKRAWASMYKPGE